MQTGHSRLRMPATLFSGCGWVKGEMYGDGAGGGRPRRYGRCRRQQRFSIFHFPRGGNSLSHDMHETKEPQDNDLATNADWLTVAPVLRARKRSLTDYPTALHTWLALVWYPRLFFGVGTRRLCPTFFISGLPSTFSRLICNQQVVGSSPTAGSKCKYFPISRL